MMEQVPFGDNLAYNNILYIGDNAIECLKIIEKFTTRLLRIEKRYSNLISENSVGRRLQHYIQYHFEGGIVIFKFKNEDDLPVTVRNECLVACQSLAFEQMFFNNLPAYQLN
jgi:hypothetical protein